ncbi:MAG TPA: hypothetical protein VHC86_15910 [Opitutaceae bacterium]|nr:hypothetical protein [Opitutaceae bacterium]
MKPLLPLVLALLAPAAALRAQAPLAHEAPAPVALAGPERPSPRVQYGLDRLAAAIRDTGAAVAEAAGARHVAVGLYSDPALRGRLAPAPAAPAAEGFVLGTAADGTLVVAGADDSGILYGCLELGRLTRDGGALPARASEDESPALKVRGPCIGLQKPTLLPGFAEYEYPINPGNFPWFYDRGFWEGYLDFLAANRMNTLFLWNGHPFASLVRVPDYPDALEVSAEQYAKNVETYRWLIREADRRGIWLVQMFYNIELSRPFAERHHLPMALHAGTPEAADYTRKTIAAFVRQYPTVGLLVCLGEALQHTPNQIAWMDEVIIPGEKDGLRAAGIAAEPPLILRTHALDARAVVPAALKLYPNLYTMEKYNGESLTTSEPRGAAQAQHRELSRLAPLHIANVHILANLEPFRYGDQRFIKECARAIRDRLGARGLHLYPLSYWDWPDTPDKTAEPLLEYQRDWIWYEAWGRYAWNPDIPDRADHAYWIGRLSQAYGPAAAENILAAYNDAGECAPRIIRRFGITEGNRQTMSLGMTLDELVHPEKYHAFPGLWEWQAPPGERLQEYVDREWNKQPHSGETPPRVIGEIVRYSERAMREIDDAGPQVSANAEEFGRLQNDIHCIRELSLSYAAKVQAAMLVLRYEHSHDVRDLETAERSLALSLDHFRTLAQLTAETYRYANGLQTRQRAIPVKGAVDGHPAYFHWTQMLPVYEQELADFRARVARARSAQ